KQVEKRSAEIQLPLGGEHEPLAVGAMGLESGEASSILNPYAQDNIDPEEARKAIQSYVAGMKRIDSTLLGTARHTAAQLLIDTFLATPYGKLARLKLLTDGKAFVPLFL
ncbi:unnamed protein product, partial [Ectocarpus sp. 12 AP-2014]